MFLLTCAYTGWAPFGVVAGLVTLASLLGPRHAPGMPGDGDFWWFSRSTGCFGRP